MEIEHLRATVDIERLTRSGWGVARLENGRYVHIPGVCVSETHLIDAYRTKKGWRGRSVDCKNPSPNRIDPDCDAYGQCAGCTHRHLTESDRQTALRASVLEQLYRANLRADCVTWLGSVGRNGYRSRAVVQPTQDPSGGWSLRFSVTPTFVGVAIESCKNQVPAMAQLAKSIRAVLSAREFPYFPDQKEGALKHITLSVGQFDTALGYRAIFATHGRADMEAMRALANRLMRQMPNVEIFVDELPKRNAGLHHQPQCLTPKRQLTQTVGARSFMVSPKSWWSQSPKSIETLVHTVSRLAQFRATDHILEVGCGVGTLATLTATSCEGWLGIDQERAAIQDAVVNAADLPNGYEFRVGDGEHWLRKLAGRVDLDVVILHAMRLPFGDTFMRLLSTFAPRVMIYIAPNPKSMLADIGALTTYGLEEVGILDQMPGTGHHLTIAHLALALDKEPSTP